MVDVSAKTPTARRAVAEAILELDPETLTQIIDGQVTKGDVLTVGELAGVMAGKRTAELIPLCHPLPLTDLVVEITPDRAAGGLRIRASAATVAATGVEMEAMTAAAIAALTCYDMVKSIDRSAAVRELRLLEKSGGGSGEWRSERGGAPSPGGRRPRRAVRQRG
jgi:cyclic pyranopterin monophosphate synthase